MKKKLKLFAINKGFSLSLYCYKSVNNILLRIITRYKVFDNDFHLQYIFIYNTFDWKFC